MQSSTFFLSWHKIFCLCHLSVIRTSSFWTFLSLGKFISIPPLAIITMSQRIWQEGLVFALVFIPLMRSLLQSFVLGNFLVHLKFFINYFCSYPLFWWFPLPIIPSACNFPSLQVFSCFPDFLILFLLLFLLFYFNNKIYAMIMGIYALIIMIMAYISLLNSLPLSWL